MFKVSELMAKSPEELTDGEMRFLLDQFGDGGGGDKDKDKPPEKVSVKLSDGTVVEASTPEELNAVLSTKLDERSKGEPPKKPEKKTEPTQFGKLAEWDYERFKKEFLEDPRRALDYADQTQFGMSTRAMVPALLAAVTGLNQRMQEAETVRFMSDHKDFPGTPEARQEVEKIIAERKWAVNHRTLSDAYAIAKAEGKLETKKETKTEEVGEKPFIPPRTGRDPETGSLTLEQVISMAEKMPQDKLAELIAANGGPTFIPRDE